MSHLTSDTATTSPTQPSGRSRPGRHRRRRSIGLGALCVVGMLAGGSQVDAARPRPRPLPTPAAPVIADIVVDDATTFTFRVTNPFESGVETIVRTVTGPCRPDQIFACGPSGSVGVTGDGRVTGLQPESTYTVSVERVRFYDTNTNRAVSLRSAPTTFTVTTLPLAQVRPSAPVITATAPIVLSGRNYVGLSWAPSTDNTTGTTGLQYTYRIAEDPLGQDVPTCSQYCFGTTGTRLLAPAAGTSISVTVTAIDANGNRSLPSNTVVFTG